MKRHVYIAFALLLAFALPALAGPYRTVRIAGNNGIDFVLPVPVGQVVQIINFVAKQSATLYVSPDAANLQNAVSLMTADTDAKNAVQKNIFVTSKSTATQSGATINAPTFIVVDVLPGDTALLTYTILAN